MNIDKYLRDYVDLDYTTPESLEKAQALENTPRIELCGKLRIAKLDPFSGKTKLFTMYCHIWRECPICAEIRKNDFIRKFETLQEEYPDAYLSTINEDGWIPMRRRMGKDSYVRIPINNDEFMLIHNSEELANRSEQTIEFSHININTFAEGVYRTPPFKKISGTFGAFGPPPERRVDEDAAVINVKAIHIDVTDESEWAKIESKILEDDPDKQTFDSPEELQTAVTIRERRLIYWCNQFGYYARIDHIEVRNVTPDDLHSIVWRNKPT